MRLKPTTFLDIDTPTGKMRTHWFEPVGETARPALMLFSEIYQMTGPIARTAAFLAGHGYVVAVPEVYHEYAEVGEAFAYDTAGTERGNRLKVTKAVASYDSDSRALIDTLLKHPACNGAIGSVGICLGGVCLYATDIHKRSLGAGMQDNTLDRMGELKADMLMIWGRQDPHIPDAGRRLIYDAMSNAGVRFSWHEFNGEHAFMRDEGHRHDPAIAHLVHSLVLEHLRSGSC